MNWSLQLSERVTALDVSSRQLSDVSPLLSIPEPQRFLHNRDRLISVGVDAARAAALPAAVVTGQATSVTAVSRRQPRGLG